MNDSADALIDYAGLADVMRKYPAEVAKALDDAKRYRKAMQDMADREQHAPEDEPWLRVSIKVER